MLYTDQQGLEQWLESLNEKGEKKLLLVTDATLVSLGLVSPVAEAIKAKGIEVEIFDDVQPNPTIANVEAGLDLYLSQQCQAILAIGGGSVMDCAKLIGARVVKPNKSVAALKACLRYSSNCHLCMQYLQQQEQALKRLLLLLFQIQKSKLNMRLSTLC